MAKQYINTKSQKNIKRLNTVVFFIVCIIALFLGNIMVQKFIGGLQLKPGVGDSPEFSQLKIYVAVISFQLYLLAFIPAAAIFFGLQSGRKKGYKENTSYTASQGITYYRDFLKDISPATMSILTDMSIESRKDISATLLRLYNKKVIAFEGGGIVLADSTDNPVPLGNDESELIAMIRNKNFTPAGIAGWKANRKREAFDSGYIKFPDKGRGKGAKVMKGCCLSGCLSVVLFFGLFGVIALTTPFGDEDATARMAVLAESELSIEDTAELAGIMKTFVSGMFLFNILLLIPGISLFRTIGYAATKSEYERTPKGEEIAEKIAGLQRFIHDFSTLSGAQKQEVFLWDDFLVYAVVLEQNESIVKEISRAYKFDISKINV